MVAWDNQIQNQIIDDATTKLGNAMKLTFKVKISSDGVFKIPVAKNTHSDNPRHANNDLSFRIDCRRAIKIREENRQFFYGGSFDIGNLPSNITVIEQSFLSTVTVLL